MQRYQAQNQSPKPDRTVHAIAAVLETVDEAIAKTEAVIAKLKQVRAGLLHDLLTRGLDENGQLRDPVAHPEQFQDSPLGRIPREWEIEPVEDNSALSRHPEPKLASYYESKPRPGLAVSDGPHALRSACKTLVFRLSL